MDVKLRILKEAGIMFSRYGIRSITMEHIANELGISKRTLYEKFEDKNDLIMHVLMEANKAYKQMCSELINNSENIIDAMFKIARIHNNTFNKINSIFFEDLKKYHPEIHNKFLQKGDIRDYTLTLSLLERGVNEQIIRSDINIDIVNIFVHKMVDLSKASEFLEVKKEDIKDSIFLPYLMGVSTDKGRKLIEKHLKNF